MKKHLKALLASLLVMTTVISLVFFFDFQKFYPENIENCVNTDLIWFTLHYFTFIVLGLTLGILTWIFFENK